MRNIFGVSMHFAQNERRFSRHVKFWCDYFADEKMLQLFPPSLSLSLSLSLSCARYDDFALRRNAHASFRSLNASSVKSGFNENLETDDYGSLPKSISFAAQVHRMRLMLKQMIYLIHFALRITASHQMWRTRCFHLDDSGVYRASYL